MTPASAAAGKSISDVTGRESLEFPSLAPDENEFSPADSLGNIKNAVEDKNKQIKISQKAILFDNDGKILTIRRTETAPTWSLHWDLPGGALDYGEDIKYGIAREIKEETGLDIQDLSVMDVISRLKDKEEESLTAIRYLVTICYTARPITTKVVLSHEHNDFKWVTPDEFQQLKASPRNKKFVEIFKFLQARK